MLAQPAPASEGEDEGLVESAGVAEVDVLDAGVGMAQLRAAQSIGHAPIVAHGGFAVDEQAETLLERECIAGGGLELLGQRGGHAKALELVEFVDDGMGQHGEGLRGGQWKYDGPRRLSWSSGKGHSGASCRGCSSRRCFKMDSTERTERAPRVRARWAAASSRASE